MHTFFVIVNSGVTVRLFFLIPMQVVDVLDNCCFIPFELFEIIIFTDGLGDSTHGSCHHANPADQISVKLTRMWRLRSWVVVESGGKNVSGIAAAPPVAFFGGERISVVRLDVSPLGLTEPEVMSFE